MSKLVPLVRFDIGQGHDEFSGIIAQLIYENGRPFALLPPGRAASLPEKVALFQSKLRKLKDETSGVPEQWDHPLVAIP
jgi:hypothetical protein